MKGFLSIQEISEKWGVSERLVNQYCIEGRIPGAGRFGRSWAIPDDAEKPGSRPAAEAPVTPETENPAGNRPITVAMPLVNSPFEPGKALDAVNAIADPQLRRIAMAEYYYFSGRAEEAAAEAELFLMSEDMCLRISACWIYGYANLATGHIHKARFALTELRSAASSLGPDVPPQLRAMAGSISLGAAVLLHLPLPENIPPMAQLLAPLPAGLQYFALYIQAHHSYLQGHYHASLGIAETALALQPTLYPIPAIYLHMVAAMDYMSLRQVDKAREHILAAWEIARPDDLIEAFGEHHGLLGGLLEAVIKKDWPDDFKRMIAITYTFSAGWRKIHNPDTGNDVADNLSTTEFATAMLAARGWTNQEISEHMGTSPNTVKRHISTALQKLNISQRKELKQFMLQ